MSNVVLIIQIILALALTGVILMQRSEGGGLGIGGGGGGGGGMMSGRAAATALSKLTWILAIGFMATSITLTILATQNSTQDSVIERLGVDENGDIELPPLPPGLEGDLTAPVPTDAPATPPKAE
jgi:preprotein translocase subunit SecG